MSTKENILLEIMDKLIDGDLDPDEILEIASGILEKVHDYLGAAVGSDDLIDDELAQKRIKILKAMRHLDAAKKVGMVK